MTATNHALTGTAIGLLIGQPLLAMPIALMSHFVCDAIPHFGANDKQAIIKSKGFKRYLVVEAFLCFLIVLSLLILKPDHWLVASICAFLAAAPDLYWFKRFRAVNTGGQPPVNRFSKFASGIQWFQRPIGALVEVTWFAAALILVIPLTK